MTDIRAGRSSVAKEQHFVLEERIMLLDGLPNSERDILAGGFRK
jgi:hypothetical protein